MPHEKLLEKISLYGIDTLWFRNYLFGHTQQVQVRGADGVPRVSEIRKNSIGVYQGGALSCILYMLFANDSSLSVSDDVTVVQFADDTQLLVSGSKSRMPELISRMERALNDMYQWFCHNGMKLNTQKTQLLVIGTPLVH